MVHSCFICNVLVGDQGASDLFADYTSIDAVTARLLSEIVDKPVLHADMHSDVICRQCYNICLEYDNFKKRMQEIKREITNTFIFTLPKHNMEYNTYPKRSARVTPKKVVLPASKLQPLPPNYVIDVSNLPKNVFTSPKINLKVTVGSTVLTQSIKTAQSSQKQETVTTDKAVESNIADSLSSILGVKTSTSVASDSSMLTFNVDSAPSNFVKTEGLDMKEELSDSDDDDDDLNNDEQPMEIDEECTITKITGKDLKENVENDTETTEKHYMDVSLLPITAVSEEADGKLADLETNEDEDETETQEIVMEDESGSVIRLVVAGRQLLYEGGALTLAAPDSDHDNPDDDPDSADEAQIELQVSGDEETANAIIAAAHQQGGAFIKVESGEMFRVKSVKSQGAGGAGEAGDGEGDDDSPLVQMVAAVGDKFKCLLCEHSDKEEASNNGEMSAEEVMQHLRAAHDARLYVCARCHRVMRRRADYTAHTVVCLSVDNSEKVVTANDKNKVHECRECHKKFTSRTLLQEHSNAHTGARPYACAACGKTYASKYTHQAHLKTHQERPRPYKCKECPKSFLSQQNLTQHAKTHLGIKDFVCNVCGKAFGTQHNLEVHFVVHSRQKPFMCSTCGKHFARKAEVKDHMRTHTGERPFSCDMCDAAFSQRSNLNSHRRATHLHDKRHACAQCPKRFKRRRLLDYHVKVSHTGERPLRCEVCHATFVYPEHFKKHSRIHSGEKPFVCEVCGKSFNSRDNRNTHRFVHSDKKPYECLVCGLGFMRKQLLYAHMNSSGHLAESIVVNQPRVQKINEKGATSVAKLKPDDKFELLFPTEASEELELTTSGSKSDEVAISESQDAPKYILQDGKTGINLVQETDDPALLTFIQNLDGSKTDGALHSISAEHLGEQVQMVTTDENGVIRVVQLHINANPATWMMSQ